MTGICFLALGFADFPLITMHVMKQKLISTEMLPLLYAAAMLMDAFSALLFGWLYDKHGIRILMISSLLSSLFSVFIFTMHTMPALITGVFLWGIGMGAQESILKSVVSVLIEKKNRSTGFGIFETAFGVLWFLGSWLMGALYDISPVLLVVFSVSTQAAGIPFFYLTWHSEKNITAQQKKRQS